MLCIYRILNSFLKLSSALVFVTQNGSLCIYKLMQTVMSSVRLLACLETDVFFFQRFVFTLLKRAAKIKTTTVAIFVKFFEE